MAGGLAFLVAAVLSGVIVWQLEAHAVHGERERVARVAADHGHVIEHTIEHALAATHALAALVRQGNGRVPDFESVAAGMLPLYPGASALALAPGGVVRNMAPLSGNEQAIGLDLLAAPTQRKEALRARDSGRLTLAGPFELAMGGTGVVGRLPVFLEDGKGKASFWGFTIVVMRLPGGLDLAHLSGLDKQGLAYELWRIHPDSGQKQIIARASPAFLDDPVEQALQIPNASWTLSVAPARGWGHPLGFAAKAALALLFSLMLGYLVRFFVDLRTHKQQLEARVAQRTAEILLAQRRLRATLDAIPDLVWLKDADGVFLSCNPMFERLYGAREADIVGKTDYDFVDREQADFFREHDRQAMAAGRPSINEEWLNFADDGSRGLFETIKTPILDEDGKPVGVLGVARDITARVQAQRELLESQQRTQQYLNIVGVMLIALDAEGRVQLVNRKGCEILGVPEADILGKDWFQFFLPERLRKDVRETFFQLLQGGQGELAEYAENPVLTQRGEERMVAWHNALLRDEAGRAIGVLASGEDITERKLAEQALRDSRESLRLLLDSMAEAAYGVDFDGNCTFVNRAFLKMLGYEDEREVLDKRIHALIHHARADGSPYPESECHMHHAYRFNQAVNVTDEVFWRKDGVAIPVEYWSNPIVTDGVVVGAIATFVDITGRKRAKAQLELAATVFEQSGEGILITDAEHKIILVNQAFTAITGYSESDALGHEPHMLSSGRHDRAFYRAMWEAITTQGRWQGEIWNRRKDGSLYQESLSIIRVLDAKGEVAHYIGISSDITQHKEALARIQQLAHYDPLTGLPNRALLRERIRHDLSTAQRKDAQLAVLFVDLDHFKNVNDTLGHRIGDELLVAIAGRLKAAVREVDTVSRQGGDEFILILPDTDADGAVRVAAKLLEAVSQPCQVESFELTVTLSIGIAMYPADGHDFETLSRCADAAMYRAKHDGRNTYRFFTTEMQARSAHSLQMENALRRALERKQLLLHYQPQISLREGGIVGVEALLRWQHPELGMIAPADFIPIAEESGQILPIGEWVLRSAVKQLKTWMDAGLAPMTMAVNLSAVQFRHPHLPELLAQILDEAKLAPHCLELELTESVAMDDAPAAIAVMDRLHARGIRMSIDDFGTGYSSLSYLKRFKVHRLKIDQSFVRDIGEDPEDRAIVSAIIRLADSLGLQTIAEGVETEGQLTFLCEQGCKEVQGYYFSKPLPADQFEAFVRAQYPAAWPAR
ncbi:MAG: EAL domain-containing protein [Gammaproteobacteria bacterium]|nr:EAL domain-containing protein [Gammaproteobacteria bacterium]MBU1408511.1 EAL domain-containing protein [Gammaproteobacteria bacterium]MBU1532323.1 EAL domain-containing protein [Gammaproteobacteria bacterium]